MKIGILGSYGEHNVGDEALLAGLLWFLAVDQKHSVTVFSHHPVKSQKIHKIPYVYTDAMIPTGIRSWFRLCISGGIRSYWKKLQKLDLYIIGGGGILHDREFGQKGVNPIIVWCLRILFLHLILRKPVEIIGVGVGPLVHKTSQWWLQKTLPFCQKIIVRDVHSQKLLESCGIHKEIQVAPDLAWLPWENQQKRIQTNARNREYIPKIAFQLREVLGVERTLFIQKIAATLEAIWEGVDADVTLFSFAQGDPDDSEILKEVQAITHHQGRLRIAEWTSPYKLISSLQDYDLVVTVRFHGIILPLKSGVPVISLDYSSKTKSLIEDIAKQYHIEIPIHDIKNFHIGNLISDIKAMLLVSQEYKKSLQKMAKTHGCALVAILRNDNSDLKKTSS